MTDPSDLNPVAREILLHEYEKAQDSAEHHDGLVWTVMSLNWIGSAVLMGFVLSSPRDSQRVLHKITLLSIAVVGIMLSAFVWTWTRQLREIRSKKYERCKAIELELGYMEQHSALEYRTGRQTHMVSVLTVTFLIAWLLVAVQIAVS